jgi:acyl homoserine lactone synthase
MICDVFTTLVETRGFRPHAAMVESSRFCVDPQLKEEGAGRSVRDVTRMMFAAIIDWSITSGFREIVTVTDLRLERILSRVGWPLQRLGPPREIGVTMAVAGILPANESTLATVRPPAYHTYVTTLSSHPA